MIFNNLHVSVLQVAGFTESLPFTDEEKHQLSDLPKDPVVSTAPCQMDPAHSPEQSAALSPSLSKLAEAKTKGRKATKKNRGHVKNRGRR